MTKTVIVELTTGRSYEFEAEKAHIERFGEVLHVVNEKGKSAFSCNKDLFVCLYRKDKVISK